MAAATILRSCGARAAADRPFPPATRPRRRSADELDGVVVEGFAETYEGSGFVVRHDPRVRGESCCLSGVVRYGTQATLSRTSADDTRSYLTQLKVLLSAQAPRRGDSGQPSRRTPAGPMHSLA
jgi:hypothetical protein